MRKNIANAFTLVNLLSGALSIMIGDARIALFLFLVALVADVLDGYIARLLKASSPIGADLDSLADMISFGLVPAFFLFKIYHPSLGILAYLSSIIAAAAAIRLAIFNLRESSKYFYGLASPAAAMLAMIVVMISVFYSTIFESILENTIFFFVLVLFISISMLSNVRLVSLKGSKKEITMLLSFFGLMIILGFVHPLIWLATVPLYFFSGIFSGE